MDYIKILGSYGTKSVDSGTTCIAVTEKVLIDAGNIINSLKDDAKKIEHIFLTHSHIDHIVDLPFLIDLYYADQKHTLQIYALQETIDILKKHIFNFDIYPDFSQINLQNSQNKALEFNAIEYGKSYSVDGVTLIPVETNHTVKSCGYIISKESKSILFTADTYINDNIWNILNRDKNISSLITEVSFTSDMQELAKSSKHYTPKILHEELKKLKRDDVSIYLLHFKPNYMSILLEEIEKYNLLKNGGDILKEGYLIYF
jgi:ribonuclease BN (tRNA processing enzyme)